MSICGPSRISIVYLPKTDYNGYRLTKGAGVNESQEAESGIAVKRYPQKQGIARNDFRIPAQ